MWRFKKRRIFLIGIICTLCVYVARNEIGKSLKQRRLKESMSLLSQPIVLKFNPDSYINKEINLSVDPFAKHAFNVKISNGLPVDREIPDSRNSRCKEKYYDLPESLSVSVIITFFNEARSTLLRTIVSVWNRSPPDMLKEIILVDDFSNDKNDGLELSEFPKVKVIRNAKREGLARSRMIGVDHASGSHVVFLDSHCEVNVGWLEPLLQSVIQSPKAIVSPVIDIIDTDTFEYKPSSGELKGGFEWNLHFKWESFTKSENETRLDPSQDFKTPVIPGGLFLVDKSWFEQLGGFDKGLEIWGAENIEVSIKAWLCGGEVLTAPCSRVGHIFRKRHPYSFPPNGSLTTYLRNSKRIAEAWLDDYKQQFYHVKPEAKAQMIINNETEVIKEKLSCKPFQWFIDNVYPQLKLLNKDALALGQLQHANLCLEKPENGDIIFNDCSGKSNQEWYYTKSNQLFQEQQCLSATFRKNKPLVYVAKCSNDIKQKWARRRRYLVHEATGYCLENARNPATGSYYLTLNFCRNNAFSQYWDFSMELQAWGDR